MQKIKLKLINVSKNFGNVDALDKVNLTVNENEIVGIFGPSGCGKTTLLRILTGLESPDSGRIILDEKEISREDKNLEPEKRSVSFVFQDLGLWPHMSVREHIEFVLQNYSYERSEIEKIVRKTLKDVGLEDKKNKRPENLSGGEKQRLAIARSLVKKSKILLLDEPFSSLDFESREKIKKLLVGLRRTYGLTIVYVTHDVFDLVNFCDRVAEMNDGRIVRAGNPKQILRKSLSRFQK